MADNRDLLLKKKALLERRKALLEQQPQEAEKSSVAKQVGVAMITPRVGETTMRKMVPPSSPQAFAQDVMEQRGMGMVGKAMGSVMLGGLPGIGQMTPQSMSEQTSPLALLSNLMIMKGLQAKGDLPIYPGKHLPQIMNKNYTMQRARGGAAVLDSMRSNLGKAKEELLAQVGEKAIDVDKLQKNLPVLPKNIISKFDDPIYQIERLPDGSIKPTIKNLDKVKGLLGDNMSGKDWEEATNLSKSLIKQAYGAVGEAIIDADPSVARPLARYHRFMRYFYNDLNKTLRTPEGGIAEKKLRATFSPGAERRFTKAWERLGQADEQARQIVKDMKKFTSRQIVKKTAAKVGWRVAPWVGGATILKSLLGNQNYSGGE